MRAFIIFALALSFTAAHAAPERKARIDDTAYFHAGTYIGVAPGGAPGIDLGNGGIGLQAAIGVRLTPDLAVQLSGNHHTDVASSGVSNTGVGLGLSWFVFDWTAINANVRYRHLDDDIGLAEGIGYGIGQGFCLGGCTFERSELRTHDIGLEVALVSTVQWSTFTFGVEWVSLYQPLAVLQAERDLYVSDSDSTRQIGTVQAADVGPFDLPVDVRLLSLNFGAAF